MLICNVIQICTYIYIHVFHSFGEKGLEISNDHLDHHQSQPSLRYFIKMQYIFSYISVINSRVLVASCLARLPRPYAAQNLLQRKQTLQICEVHSRHNPSQYLREIEYHHQSAAAVFARRV